LDRTTETGLGLAPFCEDQHISGEVPIEIEDKPTAVSIMREFVERLQDTTEALKREIVRNPLHTTGLTALVGREEECELLLRRWSRAKTGEGQVVLIAGEAGIGKSRLTRRAYGTPRRRTAHPPTLFLLPAAHR
jgi:transcriptional regulator with AAA-type ATPase domain